MHSVSHMDRVWILVANHEMARVFERTTPASKLRLVHILENPDGRLKSREIDSDRPGRHMGPGVGRSFTSPAIRNKHGFSQHNDPQEQSELDFCRQIADFLYHARARNEFSGLVLAAGPHILGNLRVFLDKQTEAKVFGTVSKNMMSFPPEEIRSQLDDVLAKMDFESTFGQAG